MPRANRTRRRIARGRFDLAAAAASGLDLRYQAGPGSIEITAADPPADPATGETSTTETTDPPRFAAQCYDGRPMNPRVTGGGYGGDVGIIIDLATLRVARNGNKTPVLHGHDQTDPIGHTDRIDIAQSAITAQGVLSVPGPSRDRIVGGAAGGFRWAVSVGVTASELEYISASDTTTVNGRTHKGPLYVARRCYLREISLLSIGADATASATVTSSPPLETPAMPVELRAYIEALGFSPDLLNEQQVAHFRTQWEATLEAAPSDPVNGDTTPQASHHPGTPEPPAPAAITAGPTTDDLIRSTREAYAAEERRIADVRRICAAHGNPATTINGAETPVQLLAIEAGWDATRTELEALRASRPAAPAAHSGGSGDPALTVDALAAGLLIRAGVQLDAAPLHTDAARDARLPAWLTASPNAAPFQRVAEAGRHYRDLSLVALCQAYIQATTGRLVRGSSAILEAAFSTNSIAALFGTTVGARALLAFREMPDTTVGWTTRATVPDFEKHDRPGLDSFESLDFLPAGGEAGHAKRTAWSEEVQAHRYSKQWAVDEQDMIGDRLDLLTRTPRQAGMAAGRLIPDLVYGLILANPTMARTTRAAFHVDDGTLLASTPFTGDALSLAIASLMKQKDGDATLNLTPTHLLVPPELIDKAYRVVTSPMLGDGASASLGTKNPLYAYGIQAVSDGRLSNGVIHPKTKALQSGSTTAWYLLSTMADTIEAQTVEGTGGVPVVRVSALTQGKFGMHCDVHFDAGAKILENRTMRKNVGT